MTSTATRISSFSGARSLTRLAPHLLTAATFLLLFYRPFSLLAWDWWHDPDAGHGLLLAPLALWLGWRAGRTGEARPQPVVGGAVLLGAVLLRYLSGLAAEVFTMRLSMVIAAAGIVLFVFGIRQLVAWWLPFVLFALSIPMPDVLTSTIALPLQFKASAIGAELLRFRHVPVTLSGNVIILPGRQLFVTEACSGLRSLTALLSLGVLVGGLWLRYPLSRAFLVAAAIPVAMLVNGFRVFVTGFLVYFVSPSMGDGFMHLSEGWLLFVIAFGILGGLTWLVHLIEERWRGAPTDA